jgi:peptidoglycan glycosyltransferase
LRRLAAVVVLLFASLFASATYVQFVSAHSLDRRPGNARTLYKDFGRERQPIVLAGQQIAKSVKVDDNYQYLRTYPNGPLYSAVTGYYSIVYGATGIESTENGLLSGTSDQLFYRRVQDLLTGKPAQGATVELTINAKAQKAAWDALGDQRGAVVALDPKTGNILAMVSKPAFDPNVMAAHNSAAVSKARAALLADDGRPLENRAIAGRLYPPGSTFKLITAAAALESGTYTPDTQVDGPAVLDLPQTDVGLPNDFAGECAPGGKISLIDALKISCNTAFGSVGLDLGDQALRTQAEKFGFGKALSVPLTVTPSTFPAQLSPPQVAQSAIGQFDVRVTPLQMAMVSAAIANGGRLMKPNLISRVLAPDFSVMSKPVPEQLEQSVSEETARALTQMMETVVNSPGGTGSRAQIDGVVVAGKTGTAEQGTRANPKPPNAWFTAFAPADAPQVAVAVVVDDGGTLGDAASGGRVAAPIAKKVMEAVISR